MEFAYLLVKVSSQIASDRERQRHVRWWIRDLDDLLSDPMTFLSGRPAKIGVQGAANQRLLSVIGIICFGIGWTILWLLMQEKGKGGVGEMIAFLASIGLLFAGFTCVVGALVLLFKRRRQIVLSVPGVEFRLGRRAVYAPWALFCPKKPRIERQSRSVRASIDPQVADEVTLFRGTSPVAIGHAAAMRCFRFVGDSEIELTRAFWAEPAEVAALLYAIGPRMIA
jgi:hypothetical protein